jgi:transcriptional regulator with XRE-family HTH domain
VKLASKIRNARLTLSQRLGYQISQSEFAKMCGFGATGQSRLSNYECGKRAPSLEDLLRIIAVSGASPKDFFDPADIEGMELEHIEGAFKKVAEESAIPKNLFRTDEMSGIVNSVESHLIDPAAPMVDDDGVKDYAVAYADRDSELANNNDALYIRKASNKINRSGWYVLKVGSVAIHDHLKVMPNGKLISGEYGEINPDDLQVIGKVDSVWKKV